MLKNVTKHIVILGFMLLGSRSVAQNLIKNPSFESHENCPKRLGNFDADVIHWSTPTEGSTDYFNGCSTIMGTPKNFNGNQPADFGQGYSGLYLYAPDDYREYLQGELSETLEKGKKYTISFYVSLAERSDFAVKEFGILFSKNKMKVSGKKELSKKKWYQERTNKYNFLEIGYSNFYSDTKDWILVHSQFTAKGTENYLIMGNFKTNERTRMFKTKKNAKQGAYYYVDMFRVESVNEQATDVRLQAEKKSVLDSLALDKPYVFENVLFDFDKFKLLEPAEKEIRELFRYVNDDPSLRIKIIGHTDSIGSKDYNQALSSNRAQVVAAYLQSLGMEEDRIICWGRGGEKPIGTNDTAEGRRKNRRVEFVIAKK